MKNLNDLILNNYQEFEALHDENSNMEIPEADFTRAQLSDCNFSNIDFSDSTFQESNLENIDFTDCDLTGVDFSHSNIIECNFTGSILNGAIFSYSTVNYCNFADADMAGANLSEADLADSDFSTSENLDSCRFDESTIWPDDEKLPEEFDCTYNYDSSSLREEDEVTQEVY